MLATGLLILKIIGLLLLGFLGLLLALLLLVLLAPLRYRAEISYDKEAKAKASVSWLLCIFSCKAIYDGELDVGIRIFGFPIGGKDGEGNAAGQEPGIPEKMGDTQEAKTGGATTEEAMEETPDAGKENLKEELLKELEEESRKEKRAGQKQKGQTAPDAGKKRLRRFSMPFSFQGIGDKLKQLKEQKSQAMDFLGNEENQKTFRLLFKQLKALLKHILPVRIKGNVKFGFDDPYTTGQVLMYISPFYGIYGRQFQVIPVFEEAVLEGEAWVKGRIRVGTVLAIGIRMLFDKNFRRLLRKRRK